MDRLQADQRRSDETQRKQVMWTTTQQKMSLEILYKSALFPLKLLDKKSIYAELS